MKKYVIKNCPVCLRNHKNVCIKSIRHSAFVNASETELYKPCKDITDCIMKQIVDELRKEACVGIDCNWCIKKCNFGKVMFSKKILELLEIEEVDE